MVKQREQKAGAAIIVTAGSVPNHGISWSVQTNT
jgi:hypothetical protein